MNLDLLFRQPHRQQVQALPFFDALGGEYFRPVRILIIAY